MKFIVDELNEKEYSKIEDSLRKKDWEEDTIKLVLDIIKEHMEA